MTIKGKIVQLGLISTGLLLILATYFLYPETKKSKIEDSVVKDNNINIDKVDEKESDMFENVEYKGLYNIDSPFTVRSEKADIFTEEPDIIYMTEMHVILKLSDGRTVDITSDKGKYNKITYDCYFQHNVRVTDGESVMLAENLDLLASKNSATIYNNVVLTSDKGSLYADKIDYDFEKRYYHISTFDNKKVKIKIN